MQKNLISTKQAISILIMFIFGNALMYLGSNAKQDTWIAIIIATILFLPLMLIYARIASLYPGQALYETVIAVFGKYFGKVIVFLYVLYAIHLSAFLMRFFAEFSEITVMQETPQIVTLVFLFALGVWMAKSGVDTLGRWASISLPVIFLAVLVTLLISIKSMDFCHIKPIWGTDMKAMLDSSFTILSSTLFETVLFTVLFGSINEKGSPYKIYFWGVLISMMVTLIAIIRNILVLGFPSIEQYYFISYTAVSVIGVGDFFTRMEVLIGLAFILDLFVKLSVSLIASSAGIATLFNFPDYKKLAVPVGLLCMTLAVVLYASTPEMYDWMNVYKYFALPFQVILPIIIWAGVEIKARTKKMSEAKNA